MVGITNAGVGHTWQSPFEATEDRNTSRDGSVHRTEWRWRSPSGAAEDRNYVPEGEITERSDWRSPSRATENCKLLCTGWLVTVLTA
ncbi:hypothetical protein ACIP6X_34045 [Streptomyces coeruleorubidus]|uniref:hypothetical protein n=1 Tax=Streptomyces coeruleorubidus TaxID=116188 RepID=UPI00380AF81A